MRRSMAITNGRPFSSLPNAKHPAVVAGCGVVGCTVEGSGMCGPRY